MVQLAPYLRQWVGACMVSAAWQVLLLGWQSDASRAATLQVRLPGQQEADSPLGLALADALEAGAVVDVAAGAAQAPAQYRVVWALHSALREDESGG